ncbi:hypothetical protein C6P40_004777 [Pichia californica]|uniref:DNL-type domain-containing protein n=1 Tax=Pichia californica TaxID=460514 RepID=A0A9P6WPU9_9ASCO|nr:hypothetical protein C6P40_004777 [[Candida] californica]
MLRRVITPKLVASTKQYLAPVSVTRNFTSFPTLCNENDKPNGGHSHTHNGTPCSGHTHNHDHSHSHAGDSRNTVKIDKPMLMLAFTCKKCDTRSSHVMSKQAYQHGTILVQCPGCKSRHLIADHLKIFSDHRIKLEDIMKAQGENIKTDTTDLVFEDIPESLKKLIGHHAKDAPAEFRKEEHSSAESAKIAGNSESEKK